MKTELTQELRRIGWDELYERYVPGLAPVNARGERRALSPFPDTVDRNPSFSVNVNDGLWYCFKTDRGGDFVRFISIIEAEDFDNETGLAIEDYASAERKLMQEYGLMRSIDRAWVDRCRDILYYDPAIRESLLRFKPCWNPHILYQYGIGYSEEHRRFTIPIFDKKGNVINCRLYRPGGEPKFLWLESGAGGNFLWPNIGWVEKSVILVEGETDVITLRSYGFPAISGTVGAGGVVPEGEWYRNKTIYICTDEDEAGREAEKNAIRTLKRKAERIFVVKLPSIPNQPDKYDISDYVSYLMSVGLEYEQIQRYISELLTHAEQVDSIDDVFNQEPDDSSFSAAITSENLGKRLRFQARVAAKSSSRYILPVRFDVHCPTTGHTFCKKCPMREQFHGHASFIHDPRSRDTFKLIQVSDDKQAYVLRTAAGIPDKCTSCEVEVQSAVNIEGIILNDAVDTRTTEIDHDRGRKEALVIVPSANGIQENRDYTLTGFVYAHPQTQQGVFLVDGFKASTTMLDRFELSPEVITDLKMFQPREMSVFDKLIDVANDLADSITLIKGRTDLHLAYRTVWHSALHFNFCGKTIHRGWIECLVLGDTRCGKSEAFKRLSEFYDMGILVDCKMQSIAGILGTTIQSQTGEYYVTAGLMPQNDGRVMCFDEFTVPRNSTVPSIIEQLSSTRSDGIVRISKAASAEFKARVRSIWLANPGFGKLIMQHSDSGVELISRLIRQPEDIARFDMALCVSQGDVAPEIINTVSHPTETKYSRSASRDLLMWAHSRTIDQIKFDKEAEQACIDGAIEMHRTYDSSIPLVEIADQRNRIAKLAVSVAAQCFSTTADGSMIIVRKEHVEAVRKLYSVWYDKPVMGYSVYSDRVRNDDRLTDENEILRIFTETVAPNGARLAEELMRLDEFSERSFATIVPNEGIFTKTILQILYKNRAIHLIQRGRKDSYEKTPAFVVFLKRFLAEHK